MKRIFTLTVIFLIITHLLSFADSNLTNPYKILDKHLDAVGGMERLKAEKSSYIEGDFTLSGMKGKLKVWSQMPDKNRTELDIIVLKQISGDNGKFQWKVDMNGKILIMKDPGTIKDRKVKKLMAEFEHLKRDSKYFKFTYEGIKEVRKLKCYELKMINTISDDIHFIYIDTKDYLERKTVIKKKDMEIITHHSDFRKVNGLTMAFKIEFKYMPIGQVQVFQITKYEPNISIDLKKFEPPVKDIQDFKFENGTSAEDIPFHYQEHIYLKVNINGSEKLWALDSGASMTVIDSEYAKELGLKMEGNLKGQGAGDVIDFSFVKLPPYKIKGINFQEQQVVSTNISGLFKMMGLDVGGVLGYDFLSRFLIKIDYANEKISFYDPEKFKYKGSGKIIEAPLVLNMFNIPITIDGKYKGRWRVDIGSNILSFHYPFAKENKLMDLPGDEAVFFGVGGEKKIKMVKFKTLEVGGFILKDPYITVPMEEMEGALSSKQFIGNAGNSLFRHFILYLDYKHQRIILEKGADFDKKFPKLPMKLKKE